MFTLQFMLQVVALLLALTGLLISAHRIYLKTKAERKLESFMHERERENVTAIREALRNGKVFQEKERLMLDVILRQLTDTEKDAIMKSFNKKNSVDQRRYIDKLIEESGSEKAYKELLVRA